MSTISKRSYSVRIEVTGNKSNLYLIKLFRGASNKSKNKLFQFLSVEIPQVKQIIELYNHYKVWHESSIRTY